MCPDRSSRSAWPLRMMRLRPPFSDAVRWGGSQRGPRSTRRLKGGLSALEAVRFRLLPRRELGSTGGFVRTHPAQSVRVAARVATYCFAEFGLPPTTKTIAGRPPTISAASPITN
jgi:hypothetical protein